MIHVREGIAFRVVMFAYVTARRFLPGIKISASSGYFEIIFFFFFENVYKQNFATRLASSVLSSSETTNPSSAHGQVRERISRPESHSRKANSRDTAEDVHHCPPARPLPQAFVEAPEMRRVAHTNGTTCTCPIRQHRPSKWTALQHTHTRQGVTWGALFQDM